MIKLTNQAPFLSKIVLAHALAIDCEFEEIPEKIAHFITVLKLIYFDSSPEFEKLIKQSEGILQKLQDQGSLDFITD